MRLPVRYTSGLSGRSSFTEARLFQDGTGKCGFRVVLLALLIGLAAGGGCAAFEGADTRAPVQEMSDARQAVSAAERAGAREHAPKRIRQAERLLDEAAERLAGDDYRGARAAAVRAHAEAVAAREAARESERESD